MNHHERSFARLSLAPVAVFFFLATLLLGSPASATTYTVIDLATLAQGSTVVVRGPNSAGTAVGGGRVSGARRGLIFTSAGVQQINGLTGTDYTTVFGINDVGGVVGGSNTACAVRAFQRTQAGAARELPPLAGDSASTAYAVNNVGQVAGYSSGPAGERAVLWAADGRVSALPGASGLTSRALAVNERGDVVGVLDTGAGLRAILWPGGRAAQDLGTLPGYAMSAAAGVNARGDIVGYSANAGGARRATLWRSGGGIVDLGTLPGGGFSQALGSNDAGAIVGTSTSSSGSRAFLWTPLAGLRDLNDLIVTPSPFVLTQAVGINIAGMIVAIGHEAGDEAGDGHESHELPIRVLLLLPLGARP